MIRKRAETAAQIHVRRMYVDCRYGQLHLRSAFSGNGGFDELTSLVCLHPFPRSSRVFAGLMGELGRDRTIYAPDLPGYGQSDPPPRPPTIADYASAVADILGHLRLRQVDLLGRGDGSLVAAELAIQFPELVRRIVMIGVPLPDDLERRAFNESPRPMPPRLDGSHLQVEWERSRADCGSDANVNRIAAAFADKAVAGPMGWWGGSAAVNYPVGERLGRIQHPVLLLRPEDQDWTVGPRVQQLLPRGQLIELPGQGPDLLDISPASVAEAARRFLD
ncbi:MAG: alpha/beta fold hydrolase [Steroidobacteraceae bacterium]